MPEQQLAIAGTICTLSFFQEAMERAARRYDIDVILARHDSYLSC